MDSDALDALEKAAREATPGPWVYDSYRSILREDKIISQVEPAYGDTANGIDAHNADFIALANPATILSLIEELRAWKANEERLSKAMDKLALQVAETDKTQARLDDNLKGMALETHDLGFSIIALQKERDIYREALESICSGYEDDQAWVNDGCPDSNTIAREALEAGKKP